MKNETSGNIKHFAEAVEYLYIGRNTLLKLLHNGTIKGIQSGESLENKKKKTCWNL